MKQQLTLEEALRTNRLEEFIKQREAEGLPPVDAKKFDDTLRKITQRPAEDRTSRSRAGGNSGGK